LLSTEYHVNHKTSGILSTITGFLTAHHSAVTFKVHCTISPTFSISFGQINVFSTLRPQILTSSSSQSSQFGSSAGLTQATFL